MGQKTVGAGVQAHAMIEGQGPHLTLIHGIGASTESWAGLVPELAERFTCLSYDLRGHGQSAVVPGHYGLDDYVADLLALLDAQGIAKTSLAGHSLGGVIAQGFALSHPERVERLVLVSTAACRNDEEREAILALADSAAREGAESVMERGLARWFTPAFQATHREVIANRKASVLATDPDSFASAFRIYAESDLGEELHKITAPTLILTGENDVGSNSRIAHAMHERIFGAKLRILPELRHAVLLEAPQLVAAEMLTFLSRG